MARGSPSSTLVGRSCHPRWKVLRFRGQYGARALLARGSAQNPALARPSQAGHRPGRSLAGRRPQYRVKVARVAPLTPAGEEASAVVDVAPTAAPPGVPGPAGQAPVAGAAAEVPVQALAATAVTADTGAARDMLEQALARASEGEARQGHEGREEPPAASTSVQTGFEFMGIRFQGSIKGMLLLNLGAALFGCNQVRACAHASQRGPRLMKLTTSNM